MMFWFQGNKTRTVKISLGNVEKKYIKVTKISMSVFSQLLIL